MEIVTEMGQSQFLVYVPIALAIVGAILVFTFGFSKAQQPKFISLDDRKTAGKKKKIKDKKSITNGQVTNTVTKSPSKEKKSPVKETTEPKKEKKETKVAESTKDSKNKPKKVIEVVADSKKKMKKVNDEKPTDFDDGGWEKVPSKKKKTEQSPVKKDKNVDKKIRKLDKAEAEALIKEAVEKQMKQKEKDDDVEEATEAVESVIEPEAPKKAEKKVETVLEETVPVVEEKKEKKKEKKQKKEKAAPTDPLDELAKEIQKKQESSVEQVEEIVVDSSKEVQNKDSAASGAVFDELGDAWTDAKAPKKGKKKTRRDN